MIGRQIGLPTIKRARGYRLYGANGRRYLDFYLNGGSALIGHRPAGYGVAIKDALDRGLLCSYPNVWAERLERALIKRFACVSIGFYATESEARAAIGGPIAEPWSDDEQSNAVIWRADAAMPSVACVLFNAVGALAEPGIVLHYGESSVRSDYIVPAYKARATLRALGLLDTVVYDPAIFDLADKFLGWKRIGRYLLWQKNTSEYRDIFERAVEGGVVLPPVSTLPAILPAELDPGEMALLQKLFG